MVNGGERMIKKISLKVNGTVYELRVNTPFY